MLLILLIVVFKYLHVTISDGHFCVALILLREMSDFSGNPFADPEDVNPFAVSLPVLLLKGFYVCYRTQR